jgi:hypothetical protein
MATPLSEFQYLAWKAAYKERYEELKALYFENPQVGPIPYQLQEKLSPRFSYSCHIAFDTLKEEFPDVFGKLCAELYEDERRKR